MRPSWPTSDLGDVCRIVGGGTPSKRRTDYFEGHIPWATVRDMKGDVIQETEHRISRAGLDDSAANIIPAGNVVIATRVGLGKVCLLRQDTAINQDLRGVIPLNVGTLSVRFLYWWLKSVAHRIAREGTGATVQGVRLPFVKSLRIPSPPLREQHRIVAILDKAFEGIAAAKANADKNLQNARALFESRLQSAFTQRPKGWLERPLGELAAFRNGINYTKDSKGERIKIVGVRNFQKHFSAPMDDLDTVTIDGKLSEPDSLRRHDILAVRSNGNIELIGRCVLVGEVTEKISHSGFTIRIRLLNGSILPEYVCHFMKSASSRKLLTESGTGTNIKSLNQGMLSALVIPFPPIAAQKVLVGQLESLSKETQRLATLYERKLAALETLKESLLHQAFTGKL